jgi:hypothetical protein
MKTFTITLAFLISFSAASAQRSDITFVPIDQPPSPFRAEVDDLQNLVSKFCYPQEPNQKKRFSKSISRESWNKISISTKQRINLMTSLHYTCLFETVVVPVKETRGRETWAVEIWFYKIEEENLKKVLVSRASMVKDNIESAAYFTKWLTGMRKDLDAAVNNTLKELLDVEQFGVSDGVDKFVADNYVEDIPRNLASRLTTNLDQLRPTFCHELKNTWHIKGHINAFKDNDLTLRVVLNGRDGRIHDGPFVCSLSNYSGSVNNIAAFLGNKIKAKLSNKQQP